jgi:hypothetical protein
MNFHLPDLYRDILFHSDITIDEFIRIESLTDGELMNELCDITNN